MKIRKAIENDYREIIDIMNESDMTQDETDRMRGCIDSIITHYESKGTIHDE